VIYYCSEEGALTCNIRRRSKSLLDALRQGAPDLVSRVEALAVMAVKDAAVADPQRGQRQVIRLTEHEIAQLR